jgi:tetratricopeptide (TPR) repeat protein
VRGRRFSQLWLLFPFLTAVVVYLPSLQGQFVWDDTALVLRDPLIRSWRLLVEGFRHFLFLDATASDFYRPIQRATYTIDYAIWGFFPAGYHLTNVILHGGAAVALGIFLRRLLPSTSAGRAAAACATALWAAHPLHTSAVAYISGRADSLAALFGFSALAMLVPEKPMSLRRAAGIGLLLLGGALSKESGLLFSVLALFSSILHPAWRPRMIRITALVCAVLAAYSTLRLSAEHTPPPKPLRTAANRVVIGARATAAYASLLVWPANLHMERDIRSGKEGNRTRPVPDEKHLRNLAFAGAALLILWIGAISWVIVRQRWRAVFLLGSSLIIYAPVSGVFGLNASLAEHWLYVPSALLLGSGALAFCGSRIAEHQSVRTVSAAIMFAFFLCLGAATWKQCRYWRDQAVFVRETMRRGGDSPRMRLLKARLASETGRNDEAELILEKLLQDQPRFEEARLNLANAKNRRGAYQEALAVLEPLLNSSSSATRASAYELVFAVALRFDPGMAEAALLRALEASPSRWPLIHRYSRFLQGTKRPGKAVNVLRRHIETAPWRAATWLALSEALEACGRSEEAADALATARKLDIRLPAAHPWDTTESLSPAVR